MLLLLARRGGAQHAMLLTLAALCPCPALPCDLLCFAGTYAQVGVGHGVAARGWRARAAAWQADFWFWCVGGVLTRTRTAGECFGGEACWQAAARAVCVWRQSGLIALLLCWMLHVAAAVVVVVVAACAGACADPEVCVSGLYPHLALR